MWPAQSFESADLSPVMAAACMMLNWGDLGRGSKRAAFDTFWRVPSASDGSVFVEENLGCYSVMSMHETSLETT